MGQKSRHLAARLLGISCLLALASCAGTPKLGGDPDLRILADRALPIPDRIDARAASSPYYVGPFDRLTIDVFGIEELSGREVQADSAGRISFPLAGPVDVLGRTPSEIEGELAGRLRTAGIREPQVTVNLKETVSRVVTVDGEVRRPGIYPVVGGMTLMGAIAKAEGTTEFTQFNQVAVFRTVQGQRYAALYDLRAIRQGAYPDPEIYAGDTVSVGESEGRRIFKDIMAGIPLLTTPIIVALQR